MPGDEAGGSRKRPLYAVALTMLVPGLGHLYLRLWGRALLWVAMTVLGLVLAAPAGAMPDAAAGAVLAALTSLSVEAVLSFFASLPPESVVLLSGVLALCIVDVYLMTIRRNAVVEADGPPGSDPQQCPSCGRRLDRDIDFCHWCTTELGDEE